MLLKHPQYLAVPESLGRRSKSCFARRIVNEMMCRKRLNQTGLAIATRAEDNTLGIIPRASADDDINRSLVTEILTRRRSSLHCGGHLGEFLFLVRFREWPDLFFEHFLSCGNTFHDLAVEKATHRPDIGYLRVISEPYRLRKAAPRKCELSL